MNSATLQKQFPDVYRDFFSKNDLVVSGCFSMSWGPRSIGNIFNKLILKSCLPIRCYVGVKERSDSKIVFGEATLYSGRIDNFETIKIESIVKNIDSLTEYLQGFKNENGIQKGYTIHLLSEIGKGHSLGFTGTFPAILATILTILSGSITAIDLLDYEKFLSSNKKNTIFQLAWKIGIIIRKGLTIGQTAMHTIYGSSTPALYIAKTSLEKINHEDIENIPTYLTTFNEISPECDGQFEIPFEYALIFSGIPSEVFRLEHSKEADIRDTNNLTNFMKDRIFSNIPISDIYSQKLLVKKSPYAIFSDAMGILNMATIEIFHNIFVSGYNEVLIEKFFDHLNHLREILSIVESQSDFAYNFLTFFQNEKKHPGENIGIFPMYSGKLGGGYVVCMKPGMSRETFHNTCTRLREKYPQMEIDYFSSIDGESTSGIRVEQDIDNSNYSSFLPKGQVRYVSSSGKSFIGDYNTLLVEKKEEILFDTTTRKIYFRGEKLTSEDVPSQTTIVDIMNILIDRLGIDIRNNEFPVSSYMKNKNEMLSKIVIPLIRFLENKTGATLPLICKGEIGTFYLKLNSSLAPIGVIRKL